MTDKGHLWHPGPGPGETMASSRAEGRSFCADTDTHAPFISIVGPRIYFGAASSGLAEIRCRYIIGNAKKIRGYEANSRSVRSFEQRPTFVRSR